jgi:predicted small lipoprotein YifL
MKKTFVALTTAVLACVALVACSQKGPAEAALNTAEQAVNQAKPEVAKYAPDQFKQLATALTGARDSFSKGDYEAALKAAQEIPAKAKDAQAAAAAKKQEFTKTWNELNASLLPVMDAIKAKLEALSAMKKLPKGMTAAKLADAKAGYEVISRTGTDAMEAYKAGNVADAVAKAKIVKDKVVEVSGLLGISGPASAPPPAAAAPAAAAK